MRISENAGKLPAQIHSHKWWLLGSFAYRQHPTFSGNCSASELSQLSHPPYLPGFSYGTLPSAGLGDACVGKGNSVSISILSLGMLAMCPCWSCWEVTMLAALPLFLRPSQVVILIVLRMQMKGSLAYLERHGLVVSCSAELSQCLTSRHAPKEMQARSHRLWGGRTF